MVANTLGQAFASVSSNDSYLPEFQNIRRNEESHPLIFVGRNQETYNDEISLPELHAALRTTKNTACGSDGIYYQMIKNLPVQTLQFLLRIFNNCWKERVFPSRWTQAILLPFLKPGKPPNEAGSYRPIALTSCLSKLMEKIINVRLMHFLEQNSLINNVQYGFRRMKRTEDAIARLETVICTAFDRGKSLYAIFFDNKKTYDTAWKYGILKALHEYGIRGPLGLFIQNFLNERTFNVKVCNCFSDTYCQEQ